MSQPGSLVWFARHETRLAWRDWLAMMTAGGRWRRRSVVLVGAFFLLTMHLLALSMVGRFADIIEPDKVTLVVVTGCALLAWSLMASQALESVTRAFYARSDLDLILSSPASARKVFAVRIATIAFAIAASAMLLASPFINVLALAGGARWLRAYGVIAAFGALATALALALMIALFRTIGPKRTRLIAQVVAAMIGAVFVIGIQIAAIVSSDTVSRMSFLGSDATVALAPDIASILWWPARAILGDVGALLAILGAALLVLGGAIAIVSKNYPDHVAAAASVASTGPQWAGSPRAFRRTSPTRVLRRKEWTLLMRDPWLVSQTLMQLLYLLPPALLLWRGWSEGSNTVSLIVPVLAMASGQLAGGLAWLAISGEDAPDLVATAPVPAGQIMRAKIEAVMGLIALIFTPFVMALALISLWHAIVAAAGVLIAAASATTIQFWFRAQAKRSQFRRRQTSSRIATFAEAFSSIAWSATAALAAAETWLALFTAAFALLVLAAAWLAAPRTA